MKTELRGSRIEGFRDSGIEGLKVKPFK